MPQRVWNYLIYAVYGIYYQDGKSNSAGTVWAIGTEINL